MTRLIPHMILIALLAETAYGGLPAGSALLFDGNSDFTNVPDSASLDVSDAATLEMWIAPVQQTTFQRLLNKGDGGNVSSNRAYELSLAQPGNQFGQGLEVQYFTGTSGWVVSFEPEVITPGAWFHVTHTFDLTAGEVRIYVNGQLRAITTNQAGGGPINEPLRNSSLPLVFGHLPGFGGFYQGLMDEVRIWNVVRTPQEIAANYNRLVDPSMSPGLVGYWRFDEAPGEQQIADLSPWNNHGTLGGSLAVAVDDPARVASTAPIVPEPATAVLFGSLLVPALRRRRRSKTR